MDQAVPITPRNLVAIKQGNDDSVVPLLVLAALGNDDAANGGVDAGVEEENLAVDHLLAFKGGHLLVNAFGPFVLVDDQGLECTIIGSFVMIIL